MSIAETYHAELKKVSFTVPRCQQGVSVNKEIEHLANI